MFIGKRPTQLGVKDGQLAPCPKTPNCVCSQSSDAGHQIAPLTYNCSAEAAWAHLKTLIASLPRTAIISQTHHYLYAEFTSAIMKFVDDVEFYLDSDNQVIHVRSASRLGKSDLGVNRRRIEDIRTKLTPLVT